MAACLPEQFIRTLDMPSPRAISRRAVSWSSGQDGGQPRSASVSPAPDKIFRTPFDVVVLARMAGRGQRQQLAVKLGRGPQHGRGLQRLVRRAGEERHRGVSRADHLGAVGGQARDRAAVPRLDAGPSARPRRPRGSRHCVPERSSCTQCALFPGAPGSLPCYASSGAAGEPGQRGRGRRGHGRDRGAGTAGPGRRDPRRHPGAGRQARRQAVGAAHPRRREVLLRHWRAAAGDQPVHALRGPGQGPPPVLVRRRPRAGGRAPGRCRGAGPARPRRPGRDRRVRRRHEGVPGQRRPRHDHRRP